MSDIHPSGTDCHELAVPQPVCYLRFSSNRIVASRDIDLSTARGEQVIVDLDAESASSCLGAASPASSAEPWPKRSLTSCCGDF
jgi:hypothetical protein